MEHLLLIVIIGCLVSYLIGSLPFGLWVGLLWKGVDIRTLGSKNIGATNVLRVLGPAPGLTVFILDTLKGAAGILLARIYFPALPFPWLVLFGLWAVVGHTISPFLGFRGGKGVATSFGVLMALSWQVGLTGISTWALFTVLTRYVSVGSMAAAVSLPIASFCYLRGEQQLWMLVLTIVLDILVVIKHRANFARLRAGTEPKIGKRPAADASAPAETEGASDE